ncbi:hypothetical protein [Neosynechococcus sphagnicola]|uniref:hypothetical protein n=1 Tax=Neosynechococcus sphagnicola TaxID=1501145 RepID=UPI0006910777|nr:hypothetical protein [Neosynechococcus sphagnicola]
MTGASAAEPSTPPNLGNPALPTVTPAPELRRNSTVNQNGPPVFSPKPNALPPLLPRAVAPPVGDLAVSAVDATAVPVNLGSNERIARLVLRDTPARDVLALLVRAAGLNFAYSGEGSEALPGQPPPPGAGNPEGPRISIDIEDESIQNGFQPHLAHQ